MGKAAPASEVCQVAGCSWTKVFARHSAAESPVEFSHGDGDRVAVSLSESGWSKPLKLRSLVTKAELITAGTSVVSAVVSPLSGTRCLSLC